MRQITFVVGVMANGGAERVISILSKIFIERGYEINILTIYGDRIDYELNEKVKYIPCLAKCKIRLFRPLERCLFIRKHYLNSKPDLIISFLSDVNIHALIASIFTKVKIIVSERNDPNKDPKQKWMRKFRDYIYRMAHGIVFQTDDAKKYFNHLNNIESTIIPNPINTNIPEPFIGERYKEIVTACRLNSQKNLGMLIDAFEIVQKKHPDYQLKIYGEGPLRTYLEKYIGDKNLDHNVSLQGFSKNIYYEMLKAKIFAISSDYEGISNSMLEALALGLPVIATDCPIGGARMFIKNGVNGILVNVGETLEMANAMIRIIEDEDFAKKLSKNAACIRSKLSSQIIADMWIEFMEGRILVNY